MIGLCFHIDTPIQVNFTQYNSQNYAKYHQLVRFGESLPLLNAALINIFISTIDQVPMCKVKSVTCSDDPTDNCQPTMQFPSVL